MHEQRTDIPGTEINSHTLVDFALFTVVHWLFTRPEGSAFPPYFEGLLLHAQALGDTFT